MKQFLLLLIVVSLFSNLLAKLVRCESNKKVKIHCRANNIDTCQCCYRYATGGVTYYEQYCNWPRYPYCTGGTNYIKCGCL